MKLGDKVEALKDRYTDQRRVFSDLWRKTPMGTRDEGILAGKMRCACFIEIELKQIKTTRSSRALKMELTGLVDKWQIYKEDHRKLAANPDAYTLSQFGGWWHEGWVELFSELIEEAQKLIGTRHDR